MMRNMTTGQISHGNIRQTYDKDGNVADGWILEIPEASIQIRIRKIFFMVFNIHDFTGI